MVMKCNIRVLKIEVRNLKNLNHGFIEFDSYKKVLNGDFEFDKSDIIGIYGPNGSSKTTIINAFSILKAIFSNNSIENKMYEEISRKENNCRIDISLYFENNNENYIYDYYADFAKNEQKKEVYLSSEGLWIRKFVDNDWTKNRPLWEMDNVTDNFKKFITPTTNFIKLSKEINDALPQLLILKGQKEASKCSLIFSEEFEKMLSNSNEFCENSPFIKMMRVYANHYYHLYDNREISKMIALDMIPFFYKSESENQVNSTQGALSLFEEDVISKEYEETINLYINEINLVLEKLIPGTKVGLLNFGDLLDKDGKSSFRYQFVSIKDGFSIPLSLESDGTKKIISIVSSLVDAFNNPFAILLIDELDSGVFEYLLGNILSVFKERGKGQLLFTSHNLRALEVIKDNIIFATNDENDRFIKMSYIGKTNNLRKKYLRDLYLGESNLSNQTDEYEIYRALSKAGELYLYGEDR